jgi:arginyl-tRNA synthetase
VTPEHLASVVADCLRASVRALGGDEAMVPREVTVERPRNPEHGDYATNAALQTATRAGLAGLIVSSASL